LTTLAAGASWWWLTSGPTNEDPTACKRLQGLPSCTHVHHLKLQRQVGGDDRLTVDVLFEQPLCAGEGQACPPGPATSGPRLADMRLRYDPGKLRFVGAERGAAAVQADKELRVVHRPETPAPGGQLRLLLLRTTNLNVLGPGVWARATFERLGSGDVGAVGFDSARTLVSPAEVRQHLIVGSGD